MATCSEWRAAPRRFWFPILLACVTTGAAHGQCDARKIVASDGGASGRFGLDTVMSGAHAVIGGRVPVGPEELNGVAYVFERDSRGTWVEIDQLTLPTGEIEQGFGGIMAIDGDVLAIGQTTADDACPEDPECDSGAVHVYTRDPDTGTWGFAQRLTPDDGAADDGFGVSVAIDGDVIVAGALFTDDGGAVYVFDRAGGEAWTQRARLTAPGQMPGTMLGQFVTIDGETLVATAPAGQAAAPRSAHVFERTNNTVHDWTHATALESDSSLFAASVAIDAGTIVIGSPGDSEYVLNGGAARLYRRDATGTWLPFATLAPPLLAPAPGFGFSLAIDGVIIAVSSVDVFGAGTTHTYLLPEDGDPSPLGVLSPEDAVGSDLYGWRTALDGNTVLVSAVSDDELAFFAGAVYEYEVDRCVGCPADLDRSGTVGFTDLAVLLGEWGPCAGAPCFADLDGDGSTGFADLAELLGTWGACEAD